MKIVAIWPGGDRASVSGGQERYGTELLYFLRDRGLDVKHIRVYSKGHCYRLVPLLVRALMSFVVLFFSPSRSRVLVHIFSPTSKVALLEKLIIASVAKLFSFRVILSLRSDLSHIKTGDSRLFLWVVRNFFRAPDVVVAQYRAFTDEAVDLLGLDPRVLRVIPNGVDVTDFWPRSVESSSGIRIGYFGGDSETKGFSLLLDVIRRLSAVQSSQSINILLFGNYSERAVEEIHALSLSLTGFVRLDVFGFVPAQAMPDKLRSIDVLLMPSKKEGFPNLLLEAMLEGVVPIAARVGAVPDLISDGFNGYLATKCDDYLRAVVNILTSVERRAEMAIAAQQTVIEKYRLYGCLNQYVMVYEELR